MTKKKPKIKIFVSHHKPGYIYEDDIFVPIQVGKKNAKVDLGILGDDTGDNISEKNSQYAELTAQYRVWKNYDLSDVDYIGFCHYRRYMTYNYRYNPFKFRNNFDKNQNIFGKVAAIITYIFGQQINLPFEKAKVNNFSKAIKKYLNNHKYDIYMAKRQLCASIKPFHKIGLYDDKLWEIAHKIIIEKYPEYQMTINNIDNVKWVNWCNIGIIKKELFIEYSERLFQILFEFEKELKSKNLMNLGIKEPITAGTRFLGCFGERLFNLRIAHKKESGYKISHHANLIFFN